MWPRYITVKSTNLSSCIVTYDFMRKLRHDFLPHQFYPKSRPSYRKILFIEVVETIGVSQHRSIQNHPTICARPHQSYIDPWLIPKVRADWERTCCCPHNPTARKPLPNYKCTMCTLKKKCLSRALFPFMSRREIPSLLGWGGILAIGTSLGRGKCVPSNDNISIVHMRYWHVCKGPLNWMCM